jgi:type II secretory ATPase GspE/PulE/Tfp pilus assembly ATPase PilB-like protein
VRGAGCAACRGTGFKGRLGIFELVELADELRNAVVRRASRTELREMAVAGGMTPMPVDGWHKVVQGLTTVEEVLRVAQD